MSVSQDSGTAWDVFHAETLELQRGLSTAGVRAALKDGSIRDDDLVRPAGTTSTWTRLAEIPELSPVLRNRSRPSPTPGAASHPTGAENRGESGIDPGLHVA